MDLASGLLALAWFWLLLALVSALIIVVDEIRHPQKMAVMNVVWPVTALYGAPLALAAWWRLGRPMAGDRMRDHGHADRQKRNARPTLGQIAVSASHCGAGCMLADILGENLVFAFAWTLFGQPLYADYLVTLGLAWIFGVAFQYFSIQPMRNLSPGRAILAAIQADTLSILFFQMGMYGWMAIVTFLLFQHPHLRPTSPVFWFLEQIGMMAGFVTTLPVNRWLIRTGLKESMS